MGAGKTTVGRLLDPNFHDMDELIVNQIGMSINDFFAREGEEAFRKIETATLESLLANQAEIISPGGGIVVNPHNRDLLEKIHTIFIYEWILILCISALRMILPCNVHSI